jgi:hypothetical protein
VARLGGAAEAAGALAEPTPACADAEGNSPESPPDPTYARAAKPTK